MNDRQSLGGLIAGQPNKSVDLNTYLICGEDFENNTLVISIYDLAKFLEDGWTLRARFTKSEQEAVRKFLGEQVENEKKPRFRIFQDNTGKIVLDSDEYIVLPRFGKNPIGVLLTQFIRYLNYIGCLHLNRLDDKRFIELWDKFNKHQ